MQACMRMRLLGKGHAVSFWASNEVHTQINNNMQKNEAKINKINKSNAKDHFS